MSDLFALPYSSSPGRRSSSIAHRRSPSLLCFIPSQQWQSSLALQRSPVPVYQTAAEAQRSSITCQRSPAHAYGRSMEQRQPSTAYSRNSVAPCHTPLERRQPGFTFPCSPMHGYQTPLERRKSSFAHRVTPVNATRTPMRPTPTRYSQQRHHPYQTPASAYRRSAHPNSAYPSSAYPQPTAPRLHPHPQPKHRTPKQQLRQQQASEPRYIPLPPFLPPQIPSKLILHNCPAMQTQLIRRPSSPPSVNPSIDAQTPSPSTPRSGSPPNRPLTALLMNLPLASKISQALKLNREIQALLSRAARGLFPKPDFEDRIEELEERQGSIREEIEVELEATWIGAGLLSPPLPPDAGHTINTKGEHAVTPASSLERRVSQDTVDRSLKRKFEEEEEARTSDAFLIVKHLKTSPGVCLPDEWSATQAREKQRTEGEEEWLSHMPVTPIGITQAMIPLTRDENVRMKGWTWAGAMPGRGLKGKVREAILELEEGLLSPRGTVFRYDWNSGEVERT